MAQSFIYEIRIHYADMNEDDDDRHVGFYSSLSKAKDAIEYSLNKQCEWEGSSKDGLWFCITRPQDVDCLLVERLEINERNVTRHLHSFLRRTAAYSNVQTSQMAYGVFERPSDDL